MVFRGLGSFRDSQIATSARDSESLLHSSKRFEKLHRGGGQLACSLSQVFLCLFCLSCMGTCWYLAAAHRLAASEYIEINTTLESRNIEYAKLESKNNELLNQVVARDDKIESLDRASSGCTGELQDVKTKVKDVESSKEELETLNRGLKSDLEAKTSQILRLEQQAKAFGEEMGKLTEAIKLLKKRQA